MRKVLIVLAVLIATPAFAQQASLWRSANGSTLSIIETGEQLTITYQEPNYELMKVGARRGSLLFVGRRSGDQFAGTTYSYMTDCPPFTSAARGVFTGAQSITITAERPTNVQNCIASNAITYSANLTRLTPIATQQQATDRPYIPLEYAPPPTFDYTITWLVRFLNQTSPYPQWLVAIGITAWALIAFAALPTAKEASPTLLWRRSTVLVLLALAYLGLSLTGGASDQVQREYANHKEQRAKLEQTINSTPPGKERDQAIRSMAPYNQPPPPQYLPFVLLLLPTALLIALYPLAVLRGWHFLFVRHPAAVVAVPALRAGSLFDNNRLADTLDPDITQFHRPPPAYKVADMLRKARILKDKIETDGEIADAAMRRDRARAAMLQAKDDLRKAKSKKSWWAA